MATDRQALRRHGAPILRPTYPSWWRSGERAQERYRQREREHTARCEVLLGALWGAAAGANVGVARGTTLGEEHQYRLNVQRMQGMRNIAPLDYDD